MEVNGNGHSGGFYWFTDNECINEGDVMGDIILDPKQIEQEVAVLKDKFLTEKQGCSASDFDYHRTIFGTWMKDVSLNYSLFCCNGLIPMSTDDLKFSLDALNKMVSDIQTELKSRG